MADIGNSNRISREYLDSLLIETRYMDSATPDISFELYGIKAASPIMTAALSHLDHFMAPGSAVAGVSACSGAIVPPSRVSDRLALPPELLPPESPSPVLYWSQA